jgi:pimeloyl-ACP methyl ester carboxylesterase
MTCLREGTIGLADGRRLGYGEYGVRGGTPVLLFHGRPGGRQFDQGRAVIDAGGWLFVLERPGFGLSDPQPGRTLLDWPADVTAFADTFGFERFAVVGFSAGGPYALACGYSLPDRVAVVGLVCAVLPFAHDPNLVCFLDDEKRTRLEHFRADPGGTLAEMRAQKQQDAAKWATDPDTFFREVFGPGADSMPSYWMAIMAATYGGEPISDDEESMYQPAGFAVEEVTVPIHAWYGDQDPLLALGHDLVRRVPSTQLTVYPGEGHFIHPDHRPDWQTVLTAWK